MLIYQFGCPQTSLINGIRYLTLAFFLLLFFTDFVESFQFFPGRCVYPASLASSSTSHKCNLCFLVFINNFQRIILLEIGGHSLRAGILTQKPALPYTFIPLLCALQSENDHLQFVASGKEAILAGKQENYNLVQPIRVCIF